MNYSTFCILFVFLYFKDNERSILNMIVEPYETIIMTLNNMLLFKFSISATNSVKIFYWKIEPNKNYTISPLKLLFKSRVLNDVLQRYAAGTWDELTISFLFQRRNGFYMIQGAPMLKTSFILITKVILKNKKRNQYMC